MKQSGKIISINLAILLIYSLLIRLANRPDEAGLGILLGSFLAITLHVIVNLIIGLSLVYSENKQEVGRSFLLSAIIVLIVGFGVCWGNAQM